MARLGSDQGEVGQQQIFLVLVVARIYQKHNSRQHRMVRRPKQR